MGFNIKVIEYPNGSVQIRQYSTPIGTNPKPKGHKQNIEDELDESRSLNNEWRSASRTKQMIYQYARCGFWEWFITLTFSNNVDRYNYDECNKLVRQWLNNQRKRYAPDLKYLIVPEKHKDGAWHFHGLLANTGNMTFKDSGHKVKGDTIYNMTAYRYGFTTATKVKDIHKVSNYIGKYITKSLCDQTKGKNRYFVSKNMPLPNVTYYFVPPDTEDYEKFIGHYCEVNNRKVTHVTTTQATYTNTTYFELQ